eukprot:CAMPEP_0174850616 /NCGR_PEP_ID=MMETSP1114-20130205/20379_1 /TAXON_ID=312471 /ORGANISM="Neobodo designis, Strain CCAP 1951/1" /LENGTH=166 /DNA_ID=CAMNT_0016085085 /DNA_START=162 /DNA_END=663 /DNA_ORIENTATION=-
MPRNANFIEVDDHGVEVQPLALVERARQRRHELKSALFGAERVVGKLIGDTENVRSAQARLHALGLDAFAEIRRFVEQIDHISRLRRRFQEFQSVIRVLRKPFLPNWARAGCECTKRKGAARNGASRGGSQAAAGLRARKPAAGFAWRQGLLGTGGVALALRPPRQ